MFRITLCFFLLGFMPVMTYGQFNWQQLSNGPYNGAKQDDIYFINKDTGWSVNGSGKIYKTMDGGSNWTVQLDKPGTYFRCVGFADHMKGFAGNIGTNYFPGVTDTIPLYQTTDGGGNWQPVTIAGPVVKGLCAINIVNSQVMYAGGRVGSPAFLIKSTDGGTNWTSIDMSSYCAMILDIKFFSADTGFVFAATNTDVASSSALVLYTTNGGTSFTPVYTSQRTGELCWKAHFATRKTGYLTILSYDAANNQRYVGKTIDGGLTWTELPLTNNGTREFGIGFLNEQVGWVGVNPGPGFETTDGGATWKTRNIGTAANKIRIVPTDTGYVAYAIGINVYKMAVGRSVGVKDVHTGATPDVFPNPSADQINFRLKLPKHTTHVQVQVSDISGKQLLKMQVPVKADGEEYTGTVKIDALPVGEYLCTFSHGDKTMVRKVTVNSRP